MPHQEDRLLRSQPDRRRQSWRALIELLIAGVFATQFYFRYWLWRECIAQALSSCITESGDNLTDGGMIWAIPAIGFATAALLHLRKR